MFLTSYVTNHPILNFVSYHSLSPIHHVFVSHISFDATFTCAVYALSQPKWKVAMIDDIKVLEKSNTWESIKFPLSRRIAACEWCTLGMTMGRVGFEYWLNRSRPVKYPVLLIPGPPRHGFMVLDTKPVPS